MKVMNSFEVRSNESACRKVDVLGWNKSNVGVTSKMYYFTLFVHYICYFQESEPVGPCQII